MRSEHVAIRQLVDACSGTLSSGGDAQGAIDALEKEFHRKKQRELEAATRAGAGEASQPTQRRTGEKVGRNDPCPCGSGKKYKKCHGAES